MTQGQLGGILSKLKQAKVDDELATEDKKKVVLNVFQTKKPEPMPSVNEVDKTESKSSHENDKGKATIISAFRFQFKITLILFYACFCRRNTTAANSKKILVTPVE